MIDRGTVRPGTTIYIPFATYDSNDPSASVTLTGLATTDIEIYKDGSTTQRGSDNGYTLLDTDGIDFDGVTGIHGISINLADNSTAGFYAAGSQYWVVVASVTVDAATINFIAATFRIGYEDAVINTTIATLASQTSFTLTSGPAEDDALNGCVVCIHDVASEVQLGFAVISDYTGATKTVTLTAGTTFTAAATDNISIFPPSNAAWGGAVAYTTTRGLAGTALPNAAAEAAGGLYTRGTGAGQINQAANGQIDANITHAAGTAWGSGAITAGVIATDAIGAAELADGAITAATFAAGAIDATAIATGAIDADAIAADAVTEIQSGLATAAALDAVDNFIDTEVAAIKAVTDLLPDGGALTSLATQASVNTIDDFLDTEVASILAAVDTEVAAIKAKTDQLTFGTANRVDAQVFGVEAAAITAGAIATDAIGAAEIAADAANEIADALLDRASAIDGYTLRQATRLILSALAAKLSGAATTTVAIRDVADTKDRITATVDSSGNRTAVTLDAT